MHRIARDLRDHYWYDELVQGTLEALDALLASGCEHDEPAGETRAGYLGEPAS
jgi:hypothetical protein